MLLLSQKEQTNKQNAVTEKPHTTLNTRYSLKYNVEHENPKLFFLPF